MQTQAVKSDLLLLLTALIWGSAFVAQRAGMEQLGPYSFTAARFALGALVLLPFVWMAKRRLTEPLNIKLLLFGSLAAGTILFAGASLQQIGLLYTSAGNAAFITGLYIILVPVLGLFWRIRTQPNTWLGGAIALVGLYLLTVKEGFTINYGDALELLGALFWAAHLLLISWLSRQLNPIILAFLQFTVCALLSLVMAVATEQTTTANLYYAWLPIAYAGILSVGIAYTLQVVAQRHAPASHAAILLSLEAPFAAFAGWLILHEILDNRALIGCTFMLIGMVLSQIPISKGYSKSSPAPE